MPASTRIPASALTPSDSAGAPRGAGRPRTAEVFHTARGVWEVLLPNDAAWISCETLTAAKRIATRWAQANPPSELIVCDAYHRVVLRTSFTDTDA